MSKNVEEMKLSINCFLVNILEDKDNLVIDNKEDDVIVFNNDIHWKWSNDNGIGLHISDGENKVSISVNSLAEDEGSFDRIHVGNLLLTVL